MGLLWLVNEPFIAELHCPRMISQGPLNGFFPHKGRHVGGSRVPPYPDYSWDVAVHMKATCWLRLLASSQKSPSTKQPRNHDGGWLASDFG